ncbi:MAG: hypothetical protein R3C44_03590 [Chloroflexota bacterium]
MGSVNDKARRQSEQRLYSGDVKNPKELTDLQHEIESLGRRRDTLETDVLEALMAFGGAGGYSDGPGIWTFNRRAGRITQVA